jgi:magnesium chelatase family protein
MLAKTYTCEVIGLDGHIVEVEVDYNPQGMPAFIVVGLAHTTVQESKERVRAAIKNSRLRYPAKRFVVNLAPADLRKEGTGYDLAMAVGCLAVTDQIPVQKLDRALFVGELSLDGAVRHVRGVLSIAQAARDAGFTALYVPAEDGPLAAFVPNIEVYPVASLGQLVEHLYDLNPIPPLPYQSPSEQTAAVLQGAYTDMRDIKGQENIKRALEVAAAGGHNLLMVGSPGVGKTLMASAMRGILPAMSWEECLEVTRIHSVADLLEEKHQVIQRRPFRNPHHMVSQAGLIGGGSQPKPGEISLAHRGILFMDEFLEFSHKSLEALRQPLEDKKVTISRASMSLTYPCNFMLIAATNPCQCGYLNDPLIPCKCSDSMIRNYQQKMSGPLLERFDIKLEVPRVDYDKLTGATRGESSAQMRARVEQARQIQRERFQAHPHLQANADMQVRDIDEFCPTSPHAQQILRATIEKMNLSARGYHRILKLARSIADLEASPQIEGVHMAEAIHYRPRHLTG